MTSTSFLLFPYKCVCQSRSDGSPVREVLAREHFGLSVFVCVNEEVRGLSPQMLAADVQPQVIIKERDPCVNQAWGQGVLAISSSSCNLWPNSIISSKHRLLRDTVPDDNSEIPNGAGNSGHCEEVQGQAWGGSQRPAK